MMDKGRMFKRIRIIFLLSVFLAAGLIRCPLSAFASEPEGDAPDDRITVSADEAGTEASEEAAVSDDIKLAVPDDVYYVTDAAWAVDKNDKDYYVGDGDEYLYKSRLTGSAETERELFSAIHNDILLEEHAGKWYEGHEVIYYPASDKKVYENKASASPLGSAPASFSGSMVFNLKYLPAELSDRFYHYHSKDDDSGWEYTKLQAEKLYAWEYEPYTVNGSTRYRKVKAVEISPDDYEVFTEEGKKYTNSQDLNVETEGYTSRITLSGNVCLKASDFDNASHPIAIVALAYDAAKDADTVSRLAEGGKDILWNSDPIFEMREAGYGSLESNSIYARSYNYYTDDLYTASVLGSFSLNPYNYYFNERDNTLTLYGCSYYSRLISGFSRGYKDDFRDKSGSDLMIDTWEIPAAYTKDGKNYNVVIHNSVDEQFETRNYDHYPIMTTNLIFDAGVAFPDDSTALLNWNSMYGICPSTITIKGNTASIGGNIRKFTGFFSGGTYNKLDIKALDTSGAENMSEMFKGVTLNPGSTSDVPDLTHFNTSNVTDMSGMFREMKIIGTSTEYNVNVSGFNTSKVTDFSHMFDGYHVTNGSLNAGFYPGINTSAWDTSGAEDMSWMFANILFMENTDTGTLDISGLDLTSKLKSMQGMFFGNRRISEYGDDARGLVKIIFPKNMDTTGVTDMSFMFANCDSLSQIDNFTALDTDSVTDMSMMFGTALLDTLFGKVRTVPEPKDAGADTGSWAIDRLGMAGGTYNYYYAVNYYNGYPGDSGPAFTSLDLSNFNTQKVKYAYGMFYNMKQLTGIKWGANTTFDKLTDANHMFLLPGMESLDLTGRRFDSLKYAYGMIDLENAEEIILGADSLDLTHIDSDTNGRFSITAPVVSMDFSNVKLGADSFDADSLYDSYGEGLTEVEELIFPASAPALSASARLRTTFFDDDSNAYDYYAGGNSEALRLTTSGAGYEITDFKAGNNDNGYGLVGNGGTLDIAMDIADTGLSNNLTAYFYVDGNTGYNTARQLTPAPDIKWTVTGDAVTITVDSGSNTNDTVYVTPVKAGTATIALSVNGGEYTAAFKAAVYDGSAKVSLYAPDGSIYKGYALADGTYMVTGYESLHSNETIDLTGNLKLGSSTGSTVAISRIGKDAFSQNGENYSLRDTMKTINIPASVTDIGSSAFDNLTKLESVTIENGSQLKSIGNRAFSGAGSSNGQNIAYDNDSNPTVTFTKNPFSIDLPEGLLTIGDGAFSGADLKTVTIPSTVTSIGTNCFNGGYSDYRLESVVIRTTCLESIPDGLFSEHMKLASIKDADGNPYGFEGCVRIGDNAFYNCNSLTGNFSSDSLRYIGSGAFSSGMGTGVKITGFTAPALTKMGSGAFEGCSSMTTAVFPLLTEIPENAFYGCAISTLDISSAVSIGQNGFKNALTMDKVELPGTLASIGRDAFEGNQTVEEYKLPNSLHSIEEGAFGGNTSLKSLVISDSVTSIASAGYNGAFAGCTSLEELVIGNGLTEIPDSTFKNCKSLKKLTIGENVEVIGKDAFSSTLNGAALKSLNLPSSLKVIKDGAFCMAYIGSVDYEGNIVEDGVSTIIIPYGVTEISTYETGTNPAFSGGYYEHDGESRSTYIKELYLPETVQNLNGLDLRALFKEKPASEMLEYYENGNDVLQKTYRYDGKICYPGTRSELEAAVFAETKDAYGNKVKQNYETYGQYNVLDLFDIEYGTGWKIVNGKPVFYKEGEPVKADAGKYIVQEAGSNYYLLDENGEAVRDTAYLDGDHIYYFDASGLGEGHEVTAADIAAGGAVYGFFNDTVHAAVKASGGKPELVKGSADVPSAAGLASLGGRKYFAYPNGVLAKGYLAGAAGEGYYFDDYAAHDGRLVWYTDGSLYYTDETKGSRLSGEFPDEEGRTVTYKNGVMSTLRESDLSFSDYKPVLYTGTGSGSTEKPSNGTVVLTVSNAKGINLGKATVTWSVATQFPAAAGMKVIRIESATGLEASGGTSTVTVTALSAGTARLRATVTDGDTGVTAYRECLVTVRELDPVPEGVSVTAADTRLALGGKTTLTAKLLPENTTFKQGYDRISYTLTGKNAHYFNLTDNGDGTAKIKAPDSLLNSDGNAVTVTVIAAARNGVSGRVRITAASSGSPVNPDDPADPGKALITKLMLDRTAVSMGTGKRLTLVVTALCDDGDAVTKPSVTWSSSKPEVAQVNPSTGEITAIKAGSAKITASASDGSKKKASCTVKVGQSVSTVTIGQKNNINEVYAGRTLALKADITPAKPIAKKLVWSSDRPDIAVVSSKGVVTGISAGEAVITAVPADSLYDATETAAAFKVSVKKPSGAVSAGGIVIKKGKTELPEGRELEGGLAVGKSVSLKAYDKGTGKVLNSKSVVFYSSDENKVSVTASGKVKALEATGSPVTVTAVSLADPSVKSYITVSAYSAVKSVTLNTKKLKVNKGSMGVMTVARFNPAKATDKKVRFSTGSADVKLAILPAGKTVDSLKETDFIDASTSGSPVTVDIASGERIAYLAVNASKKCVLTAVSAENPKKKASCNITVKGEVTSLELKTTKTLTGGNGAYQTTLKPGKSVSVKTVITAEYGADRKLVWSSSNDAAVKVSSKGKVSAAKTAPSGSRAVITVSTPDGRKKAELTVTVE